MRLPRNRKRQIRTFRGKVGATVRYRLSSWPLNR